MRRVLVPAGALVLAALLALLALGRGPTGRIASASASGGSAPATAEDSFEPVLGIPATGVVVLGSSPQETPGETWAYGTLSDVPADVEGVDYADQVVLLERTAGSGWRIVPLPSGPEGKPLGSPSGSLPYSLHALGGRATPAGGVVLLTGGGIVARNPGGTPALVPAPGAAGGTEEQLSELLGKGESLPPAPAPAGASTPFAAVDEADGRTGVLIAPYDDGAGAVAPGSTIAGPGVLHYDGRNWTREPVAWEGTAQEAFAPLALACGPSATEARSSSENCWLLASYRTGTAGTERTRMALFRRVAAKGAGAAYSWERVKVADWLLGEAAPPSGVKEPASVASLGAGAQTLTVTSQGVWVDLQAKIDTSGGALTTDFSELVSDPAGEGDPAQVEGRWCFGATAPGCEQTLEDSLPVPYTSFASSEGSSGGSGTRVITGLSGGAMLELSGGAFHYEIGPGGDGGGEYGAALGLSGAGSVEDGWIGEGRTSTYDQQGQSPLVHVTPQPEGDQLQEQPVPFRHALLAVAQAPGTTPGEAGAPAIAVGLDGEIGRYTPGQGWSSEALYNSSGEAQTPTLRGVAWPEAGRAYAVGDEGAMWVWRAETGLWEPDPATPYNFVGDLTGIAFSPSDPSVGYAVGKQGVLLSYGKTWEPISTSEGEQLEAELKLEGHQLSQLNFTSIAFAGKEALATYRVVVEGSSEGPLEAGGMLVNDEQEGSRWQVDASAAKLLAQLPSPSDTVLSKVAGLSDGGAVAAGPGLVIERESEASAWRFSPQPLPEAQNVSALAAYREAGGAVRAIVSIDLDPHLNPSYEDLRENAFRGDLPPSSGPGQPPPQLSADPLPSTGYLLRETASGWSDMEHMALEETDGGAPRDAPARPDPVLALLVDPDGGSGLAVGGQTGDLNGSLNGSLLEPDLETAAAMRFGDAGSSAGGDAPASIPTTSGAATFAVGGSAACEQACADFANESLAPDVLLSHALQTAAQIAAGSPGGLRGFLYTGDRLLAKASSLGAEAFERELSRYAALLGSAGTLPVHAAASPNDLAPGGGGVGPFAKALEPFVQDSSDAYYSFTSEGSTGGPVMVIVLNFATGTLEAPGTSQPHAQEEWLQRELEAAAKAGIPAIVMGNASLGFTLPEKVSNDPEPVLAQDTAAVSKILCERRDKASAYLFDYPGVNVQTQVGCGTEPPIPAFGTGTLGYTAPPEEYQTDSLGSSGFLLVEVQTAKREAATDAAPVTARIVPNISELALQASDGTLLRRSQTGLFEALARIPLSGRAIAAGSSGASVQVLGPEPYEPIPFDCLGPDCASEASTDYTFSSSNPDVGGFVVHEAASTNPRQVQLGANGKPIPDEARGSGGEPTADGSFAENAKGEPVNEHGEVVPREQSGLFCAYNEGTTVVSIAAGGLTYSMPVTVQGGSSEYPCGTVPLKNPPERVQPASAAFPVPNLAPQSPAPFTPRIQALVPPPPPVVPVPLQHHAPRPAPLPPVPPPPAVLFPIVPLLPLPAPNVARPTPPSGTAPVTQQVGVAEEERERQGATEVSHHMTAFQHPEEAPLPAWPLGLVLIAVAAGVGIRRGGRDRETVPVYASHDTGGRGPRARGPSR